MDFTFDETQEDVRTLARMVFDEMAKPERIREVEKTDDGVDRDLWAELARGELLGVSLPEDAGGSGQGLMELGVLLEEMGRRVAPVPLMPTLGSGALPIAALGTNEQRKRWLVPVVDGSAFLTAALLEPAQHDVFTPATTAVRDGASWRIDGIKVAAPIAPIASAIIVNAATADGIRLFVVDPSKVTMEPTRSTHRELQGNITLDGTTVTDDDVLGDPDEAMRVLYRHAVASMCAVASGVLEEAVKITAAYISQREQFNKPIAAFQGATMKAADAYIDAEAVRATAWSAIWRLSEGRPCDDELAIAKYWVAEGGQRAVHACQHLHGGIGVDTDYPIHRYFLWAKELELALGGATPHLLKIGASIAGDV